MQYVARRENVFLKISGLGRPGQAWTIEANAPIIRDAVAMFGVDRCMFASNYPVDKLCAPFETIVAVFRAAVSHLAPADRRKLFHDNAVRVYRLTGSERCGEPA
jgi:predicted TIM-barrel fold metal-dependent hydrolase